MDELAQFCHFITKRDKILTVFLVKKNAQMHIFV